RGALGSGDLQAAVALARRGLELGAQGRERGELLVVQGHASAWGTHTNLALAEEALRLLSPATGSWWFSLALLVFGSSAIGRAELAEPYLELATVTPAPSDQQLGAYGQAFEVLALGAVLVGRSDIGWSMLSKFEQLVASADDYMSSAWLKLTLCQLATNSTRDGLWQLERAVLAGREAVAGMRAAGAVSGEATALLHLGIALREIGSYDEAEQAFRGSLQRASAVGNVLVAEFSRLMLAVFELRHGRREQGLLQLDQLAESSDANIVHACKSVRAEVYFRSGQIEQALAVGAEALAGPGLFHRISAAVTLARAELSRGRPDAALIALEKARAGRESGTFPQHELDLHTLRARALSLLGDVSAAASATCAAARFASETAEAMQSEELRSAFAKRVRLSTHLS
ncbi:MAG: Adenylate cyclase, partial [Myxococcaceae bacterium]|nr:Adenylate cyclase [Myxococcaceae bacterium]